MGRNINSSKLTKQAILEKISQVTIFATYLNLSDKIVQNCIDSGELICSPLREDNHPTCGFKYDNRGKLKLRDFAGYYWGDCFDLVALVMSNMYNKEYNVADKNDFIKILRHITFTFKDIFYGKEKDINLITTINATIDNIKHKKPIIELVTRAWNKQDEIYWEQFGVDIKYLNINFVYPIDQYYINRKINPIPKYYYDTKDPCYAYLLGKDRNGIYNIKLYFPFRNKNVTRFITNCNHLEGIYNLCRNDYDGIVITKSTKDRLSIGAMIKRMMFLYGEGNMKQIGVINIPHETYRLRQNEYDWLINKLNDNGKIIILMDNDRTGKIETIWLRNNYKVIPLLIPKKYNAKDFAELVKNNNFDIVKSLIDDAIKYIFENEGDSVQFAWTEKTRSNSIPF